jgi:diaminohydroxyphosphoribosylaminopyrimidine deaminase/5-amino-6-(5-phosphoribosylamino)uracil reductase
VTADERFMARALALAERARGLTSPNPLVGSLVVVDDRVVGEGFHRVAGEPHAEIEALSAAGARATGATLYVTLEPCSHHGRTPPCAPAVIAAGIRRVVVAISDPNPLVAGRGLAMLRSAGIEVTVGVCTVDAERQNRTWLTAMRQGRPHVTLKAAMTLDGRIADVHGSSQWITGQAARREAHRLRAESDAIVVGAETALRDDPRLTVRLDPPWPREPLRVVLDARARTPVAAQVITAGTPGRAVIATSTDAPAERVNRLVQAGASVVRLPSRDGKVQVKALLEDLFAREVRSVLVEGGAEVHGSFLDAGLVDRVAIFVAPLLLGGRGAPGVVGGAGRALRDVVKLGPLTIRNMGQDILIEADVESRLG